MATDARTHRGSGCYPPGREEKHHRDLLVKLTKFFSWLVLKGYLTANPLKDKSLEFPRIRYDDRKYLERKDMKKILLAVSGTVYWQNDLIRTRNIAIIAVALYCGLRRTELLSLKVSDVDPSRIPSAARMSAPVQTETTVPLWRRTNSRICGFALAFVRAPSPPGTMIRSRP